MLLKIFENPDPSTLLRVLEEMEPRHEPSFVSLGYLVQEMYGTVLSLVSRVLEMERLGGFFRESPGIGISPSRVEALRRHTEDLMGLLQFPDAANQRRGHLLQGFQKFRRSLSPLFLELQSMQLEKLLEDTVQFRIQCVRTAECMADQAFHIRQSLREKSSREVLAPLSGGYSDSPGGGGL